MNQSRVTWIPTSSVSFEDQVRVLRSYVGLSDNGRKGIQYKEVVNQTHLARTQVSGVNGFFVSLGFLDMTKRGYYVPTESVVAFVRARDRDNPFQVLSPTLLKSRLFEELRGKYVLSRVKETPYNVLVSFVLKLADSAEKFRAESAIEWFLRAGLLARLGSDAVGLRIPGEAGNDFGSESQLEKETDMFNEQALPAGVELIVFRLKEGVFAVERNSLRTFVLQRGKKLSDEIRVETR